jgi:SAM-dependent methyltransferase
MEDKKNKYFQISNRFPKKRITLSDEYLKVYTEHYIANRGGVGFTNSLGQKMESWLHRKASNKMGCDILELGAGNLNHVKYERSFINYDIIEPFKDLYQNSADIKKIRNIFSSTSDVNHKYDKIISIATLEHLTNLPNEIELCKNLLKPNGIFQIGVPCEGEFAFKFASFLTSGLSFKLKYNLDYKKIMEYEHINSLDEIMTIVEHNFKIINFCRSPFIFPIKNLSFYAFIECKPY